MALLKPGFSSGAKRFTALDTKDVPVLTATYCFPFAAYETG